MKKLLLAALSLLVLASCGSKTEEDDFFDQYQSGACGLDVVADYNSMVLECKHMRDRSDLYECESKAEQFDNKYHGISCKAERGYGLDKETIYIEQSSIDELLNGLKDLRQNL